VFLEFVCRVRVERQGGAWCPKNQITADAKEWLQVSVLHNLQYTFHWKYKRETISLVILTSRILSKPNFSGTIIKFFHIIPFILRNNEFVSFLNPSRLMSFYKIRHFGY